MYRSASRHELVFYDESTIHKKMRMIKLKVHELVAGDLCRLTRGLDRRSVDEIAAMIITVSSDVEERKKRTLGTYSITVLTENGVILWERVPALCKMTVLGRLCAVPDGETKNKSPLYSSHVPDMI